MAKDKLVYFFGEGKAEGNRDMKNFLGGKGANLAEMTNLGVPVPPGFTISAEVCKIFYEKNRQYPEGLEKEVAENLGRLEKVMGKKLGDHDDPLLVSVRSGAAISMPGMMDTVLNLGINDKAVEGLAKKTGNERFARRVDEPRGLVQMVSGHGGAIDLLGGVIVALFGDVAVVIVGVGDLAGHRLAAGIGGSDDLRDESVGQDVTETARPVGPRRLGFL